MSRKTCIKPIKTCIKPIKTQDIKEILLDVISTISNNASLYVLNPSTDFIRKRKLDFATMIHLILSMQGNSLNKELFDYFPGSERYVTSSAFVQQRDKILPDAFAQLFSAFNNRCNDNFLYNGYRLLAVDGSDVNIAKNPDSDTYFQQGFNQFHINAIYDLMNKTYFDVVIQPSPKENEIKAALEMVNRNSYTDKTILIADRGYSSVNLFEHINRTNNLDYLIRVKNAGYKEFRELPIKEFDLDMETEYRTTQHKADKEAYATGKVKWIQGQSKFNKEKKKICWDFESPFIFQYRLVRFEISPNNYETIMTSLNRFEFPIDEIKKLYNMRWGIETSFRELKYAIGVINFHAKKESSIIQEIYAMLTMYNFCERITMAVVVKQDNNRKFTYQVNFTMAIHICRDYFSHQSNKSPPDIENHIRQYILPVRPGRSDKRKIRNKQVVNFIYRVA